MGRQALEVMVTRPAQLFQPECGKLAMQLARAALGGGMGASGRLVVSLPQECAGLHSPDCRLPHVAWRAKKAVLWR